MGRAEQPAEDHVALERQDVEGRHALQQARLLLGVLIEVVVVAGGKGLGDALDVLGQHGEVAARRRDQVEEGHLQVAAEPGLADDLRVAPERP